MHRLCSGVLPLCRYEDMTQNGDAMFIMLLEHVCPPARPKIR